MGKTMLDIISSIDALQIINKARISLNREDGEDGYRILYDAAMFISKDVSKSHLALYVIGRD